MSSKRDVLEQLKRDELLTAIDRFELEIRDRRVRSDLVETLARSRKAGLADILGEIPRMRLKEICRALDLDDSGREKAVLVVRLTRAAGNSSSEDPSGPRREKNAIGDSFAQNISTREEAIVSNKRPRQNRIPEEVRITAIEPPPRPYEVNMKSQDLLVDLARSRNLEESLEIVEKLEKEHGFFCCQ